MKIVTLLPDTNKIDSAHYRSTKSVTFLTLRDNAKFNTPAKTPFAFILMPLSRPDAQAEDTRFHGPFGKGSVIDAGDPDRGGGSYEASVTSTIWTRGKHSTSVGLCHSSHVVTPIGSQSGSKPKCFRYGIMQDATAWRT